MTFHLVKTHIDHHPGHTFSDASDKFNCVNLGLLLKYFDLISFVSMSWICLMSLIQCIKYWNLVCRVLSAFKMAVESTLDRHFEYREDPGDEVAHIVLQELYRPLKMPVFDSPPEDIAGFYVCKLAYMVN